MPDKVPKSVVVTGITGFIGKHVALKFLNAGHRVTGTLRDTGRADEVRAALRPEMTDAAALERLRFAVTDLGRDAGWADAMAGSDIVVHTASPFPIAQPADENELIGPAVDGTLRALRAAMSAGVRRVVLTSSVAAVSNRDVDPARPFDERDWTEPDHPTTTAYAKSKTLAERAAWEFVAAHPELALTTINPAFVLGPPLDGHYGSSVGVMARLLSGRDPMLPRLGFGIVDVRDVAEMHLRAAGLPETEGKRYIAVDRWMWFREMAEAAADVAPGRRIPRRVAPDLLIRGLGLFDGSIRAILPMLGREERFSNQRARSEMGMAFIPAREAVQATVRFLMAQDS